MPLKEKKGILSSLGNLPDDAWGMSSTAVAEALGARLEELVLHQHLKEELMSGQQAKKQGKEVGGG